MPQRPRKPGTPAPSPAHPPAETPIQSQATPRGSPTPRNTTARGGQPQSPDKTSTPDATPSVLTPGARAFLDAAGGAEAYQSAVDFLYDRINVEKKAPHQIDKNVWKLDRMHALMASLGDPHKEVRTVHIAGSKGKGSTCLMLASALQSCGYATGLYTSPHLVDVRERVQINGTPIGKDDFVRCMRRVAEGVTAVRKKYGEATFFEVITALAFVHYAEQAVDVAVIEVGLGGRLDSTNVITPEVAAITSIQLEHTQLLGNTLQEIAREKAGIFKPGVPALTIPQSPGVLDTFRAVAAEVGCPLKVVGEDIDFTWRFEASPELGPHLRASLTTPRSTFEHLPIPLKGEHQAYNCALALAILDALRERGFETPERQVALGLAKTPNPGRFEVVWDRPKIIVDGAHNPESIAGLMKAIGAHGRFDSLVVIFGCAADKNAAGMLERLAAGADKIIFTKAEGNARAMEPRDLQRKFHEVTGEMGHANMTQTAPTVRDALNLAHKGVHTHDMICVTGSFYLAGEAKRLLLEKKHGRPAQA